MKTSQTRSAIRRMAKTYTQEEIARHFNISQGWVNKILNRRVKIRARPDKTLCDGVWTDEQIAKLMTGWEAGMSASRVAFNIPGKTRDAVIGKAHRLGLAKRPSPIRRGSA